MRVGEIIKNNEKWIPNKEYSKVNPEITIILPTFRRAKSGFFENAVLSVIKQSYPKWELIIVDDASTDGTEGLIHEFMKIDSRINCIRHIRNIGLPAISEYEAYRKSRGAYIAFLFDDNVWEKDFLYKTLLLMKRRSIKASYGVARLYTNIEANTFVELGKADNFGAANLENNNFILNASVILHRDVIEDVGFYDPHLTLTRLCDWDLWRRVYKKYEFFYTGILATNENGVCLNDSLGNSYMMNSWSTLERMAENRDKELRPDSYEDVDIVGYKNDNTNYYLDTIHVLLKQFDSKFWFSSNCNIKKSLETSRTKKRVIVVHDGLSASITLYLERLFQQSGDFVVKYCYDSFNKNELVLADALIMLRGGILNEFIPDWCNKLKIPVYYFVDDNFIELAKEHSENIDFIRVSKATNRTVLRKYNAVIVSTPRLKKYFEDNLLHNNVLLMETFIDTSNVEGYHQNLNEEELRIGFLGGSWRYESFLQYVFPAIKRMAKDTKMVVCMPINYDDTSEKKNYEDLISDNLFIEFIEKTMSLDVILQRAKKKNIDILVHCGATYANNEFKSENALLNAVQIGAVLLVSDEEPYSTSKAKNSAFLLAENTIDEWYLKLNILRDINKRKDIYEKAKEYCHERYSFNNCSRDFVKEVYSIDNVNYYNYFERTEYLLNSSKIPNLLGGAERNFRNIRLGLGTLIEKYILYDFLCTVDNLSELGVLFASFEMSYSGRLKISILDGSRLLFSQWFPFTYFIRDDWTYIDVGMISNVEKRILTIRFDCEYDKNSAKIGFFENLDNRSFFYKLFNKLGYHIKGRDAIVIDCR